MSSRLTFYSTLSHSLVVFTLMGIFYFGKEVGAFFVISLICSYLTAYLWGYIHPRIINTLGNKYYSIVMIIEFLILANIIFLLGSFIDIVPNYLIFMIEASSIGIITYNISKRIYKKEINDLNNLIKKSKQ